MNDRNPSVSPAAPDERAGRSASIFPEVEFYDMSLEDAGPEQIQVPALEAELLPALERHRLIILAGPRDSEKLLVAKQLAWLLREQSREAGAPLRVVRWQRSSELIDLSEALDRHGGQQVFLFSDLEPRHLGGFDLRRLPAELERHSQYAIVTTESGLGEWSATPDWIEKAIYFDVDERLVTTEFLAETLLIRLQNTLPDELGGQIGIDRLDPEGRIAGHSVRGIARELGAVWRIHLFAVALSEQAEIQPAVVGELLEHLADERHATKVWFSDLSRRQQVLALSLVLFDGLLDDQMFAATENLVELAWRDRDPGFRHFEYYELDSMRAYFRGLAPATETAPVECRSAASREALLEVGWHLHRRKLLAAIPVLADLVRSSPGMAGRAALAASRSLQETPEPGGDRDLESRGEIGEADEELPDDERTDVGNYETTVFGEHLLRASRWHETGRWRDLYGNSLRNGLARERLAGALSELGRLSVGAIEPVLLDLARDRRLAVQSVVADALARWRTSGPGGEGDERLYRTLSAWRRESYQKSLARWRRRDRGAARSFARVRATIALTLSRASVYDRPNQLHERFVVLLRRLLRDRYALVRSRLRTDTVPLLLQSHLRQLEDLAWELIVPASDLREAAALGLAGAHRLRPEEVRPILLRWLERARDLPAPGGEGSRRARVLAILASTFGLIEPSREPDELTATEIFDVLRRLLAEEEVSAVRDAALESVSRQASRHLDRVEPELQATIAEVGVEERTILIDALTRVYLEERRELERGPDGDRDADAYRRIGGLVYPFWIESARPRTRLEIVLARWMDDASRLEAVQFAVDCLRRFTETKVDQKEAELRRKTPSDLSPEMPPAPEPAVAPRMEPAVPVRKRMRRLAFAGYVATWIVSPRDSSQRSILQAALPEILHRENEGSEADAEDASSRLLERLEEDRPKLARQLRWAARIYAARAPLAIALGVFLLFLVVLWV